MVIKINLILQKCANIHYTDDGDVYTWGWSIYGQLGLGKERDDSIDKRSTPTLVSYFRENSVKIKVISAGGGHSAFIDGATNNLFSL